MPLQYSVCPNLYTPTLLLRQFDVLEEEDGVINTAAVEQTLSSDWLYAGVIDQWYDGAGILN